MTDVNELNQCPCDKIDANCIDAYLEVALMPENPAYLVLSSSWGDQTLDLTPAIKAGETITHLELTDTALQFNREDYGRDGVEDGGIDCITGDDLSGIISMHLLRNVDKTKTPADGNIYIYNGTTKQFELYNIKDYISNSQTNIQNLIDQVNALQTQLDTFITKTEQRLDNIEKTIAKPSYVPRSAVLAWGNINNMYQPSPTTTGIWTHDPRSNVTGDEQFK